jgi:hypothetical protein
MLQYLILLSPLAIYLGFASRCTWIFGDGDSSFKTPRDEKRNLFFKEPGFSPG